MPAAGGIADKTGRELQQQGQELPGLDQRCNSFPIEGGLAAPLAGVDLVGERERQLGGETEGGRRQAGHALDGLRFGHLVPRKVELGDAELPGIQRQHLAGLGARRVESGFRPLGVRVPAGAHENVAGGLANFLIDLFMSGSKGVGGQGVRMRRPSADYRSVAAPLEERPCCAGTRGALRLRQKPLSLHLLPKGTAGPLLKAAGRSSNPPEADAPNALFVALPPFCPGPGSRQSHNAGASGLGSPGAARCGPCAGRNVLRWPPRRGSMPRRFRHPGILTRLADDEISVQDACPFHGISAHPQSEKVLAAEDFSVHGDAAVPVRLGIMGSPAAIRPTSVRRDRGGGRRLRGRSSADIPCGRSALRA